MTRFAVVLYIVSSVALAQESSQPPAFSPAALATNNPAFRVASTVDETCRMNPTDRFEVPARVSEFSHSFPHMCVDTNLMRPMRIISHNAQQIRIANFQHQGRFWVADIPTIAQAWDSAYLHTVIFPSVPGVNAAHSQLRFKLNRGYKIFLRAQDNPNEFETVSDIIITSQTSRIQHFADNMVLGTFDNYPIVTRGISLEQRLRDSRNIVNQYKTKLTKEEIASLVQQGIEVSHNRGYSVFYNILRPNCVTEVFDLIDTLPRFQNRQGRFYTVISTDPVAGPAVQALDERGLLDGQVANLQDEVAGRSVTTAPPVNPQAFTYFRPSRETPYSFVVVEPQTSYNMDFLRGRLQGVIRQSVLGLPQIVQSMGAATVTNQDPKKILVQALSQVHRDLLAFITSVNPYLPDQPVYVMSYLVPWGRNLPRANLESQGIPAELPFSLTQYRHASTAQIQNVYNNFYTFMTMHQVRESSRRQGPNERLFFMGAAILLKLQKNRSEITIQVMNNLNAQNFPQARSQSRQMNISSMIIPSYDPQSTYRPTMLVTYSQRYNRIINTEVDFEFGGLGNMEWDGPRRGFFQIQTELSCYRRSAVVPSLVGRFGPNPTNNPLINLIANRGPVSLDFYALRFDVESKMITGGDIRLHAPGLLQTCTSDRRITRQVLGQMNERIDASVAQAQQNSRMNSVLDLLLTNLNIDRR